MGVPKTTGVVLAGQHAWRDSGFDRLSPRPLLPVANRPLVCYAVRWLQAGTIGEIALAVNAETRALRAVLAEMNETPALSLHEDKVPRGPAGVVRDATLNSDARTIIVVDGTCVPRVDLRGLLARHHESGAAVTVLVHAEPGQPAGSSRFLADGVYVFDRRAIERVPTRGYDDIKEGLLPRLYQDGEKTAAYVTADSSPRALDGPGYLALNDWVLERLSSLAPDDGYGERRGVYCHATARVSPDAVLVGQVLIGPEVQVLDGAMIVGPTSIGPGSVIGRGALISRCAVWRGCTLGENSLADRCIVPNGATLARREQAIGRVVDSTERGPTAVGASEWRPRASSFGLRPDVVLSE